MDTSWRVSSYVVLACGSTLMNTSCDTTSVDKAGSSQVSLEIRFQGDDAATQQPTVRLLQLASAAAGPTTHDQVATILVDITFVDSGLPFFLNFDLTKIATDIWTKRGLTSSHGPMNAVQVAGRQVRHRSRHDIVPSC